jgi:ribonuclease E
VTTQWIDGAIGETRRALLRDGRAVMLHVDRWSARGRRALWGEVYVARVRTVDRRRRGAYLDIGLGEQAQGFVRLDSQSRARTGGGPLQLTEGMAVRAHVRREAAGGKNAVLEVLEPLTGAIAPGCVAQSATDAAPAADAGTREHLNALVDSALARIVSIPQGGTLSIERTAALVAVDVDAGGRSGEADAERFSLQLNIDAAQETARQLRLRGLGGIIAIDFVSLREARHRDAVVGALRAAVADDPWGCIVAPMSRFGVVEMSRGQLRAPLAEIMCDPSGALTAESEALCALRALEREVRAAPGRIVRLCAGAEVHGWLGAEHIGWRAALGARIGPRWELALREGAARAWSVETLG